MINFVFFRLSFALASKKNALIVRTAAILRTLVADVNIASEVNRSSITLYNKVNDQLHLILRWGMIEARNTRNEVEVHMYDKMICLQKRRGVVDLRSNNLCLPRRVRQRENHIQTVVSFLAFIFPRIVFRELMINTHAFSPSMDALNYAKCLESVTRTEILSIKPDVRGTAYKVRSLLAHLEVTNSVDIEEEDIPALLGYRFTGSGKLHLADGRFMDNSCLASMNCVEIIITKTRFTTEDFLHFLNTWKGSNEALRRVEFVKVGHPRGVRKLYGDVGAVKWDPSRRPSGGFEFGMDIFKPDGLVGTVEQFDDYFMFKVWH
ncbi:unnamed protein product [Caenorhabditis brenneri]